MEETWEFAALMAVFYPDVSPLIREDWDWSGRHVRLKYQMFAATVFLFVVSKYTLEDFKIPFANISIVEDIDEEYLYFLVFAFWLFSLVSFLVRTFREGKNVEEIKERFDTVFKHSIDKNESITKELKKFDIGNNVKELNGVLVEYSNSMANLALEIPQLEPRLKHLFAQGYVDGIVSNATGDFQNLSLFEKGVYSQVKNMYLDIESQTNSQYKKDTSITFSDEVRNLRKIVDSYDAELKAFMEVNQQLLKATVLLGKIPGNLKNSKKFIDESLGNLKSLNQVLDKELLETLRHSNVQLKEQNAELRSAYNLVKNIRGWTGFDRVFLSVLVPSIFSLVIATLSIVEYITRFPKPI